MNKRINIPEYKLCLRCGEEKHKSEFYLHFSKRSLQSYCIECVKTSVNENRRKKTLLEDAEEVLNEPHTFISKYQKDSLFAFLTALGWTWNGERWYKDGVINQNGTCGKQ